MTRTSLVVSLVILVPPIVLLSVPIGRSKPNAEAQGRNRTSAAGAAQSQPVSAGQNAETLDEVLEPIRRHSQLPALAAAVVRDGRTVASGAVGLRRVASTHKVTPTDVFHIGSCTKAMTATLMAMLVERGTLSWGGTIAQAFPALKTEILADYHEVTLEQLLLHRSGLPDDTKPDSKTFPKVRALKGPIRGQRLKLVELALQQKPSARPGTKMLYSNFGYVIAGAMAEQATGKSWEDLLRGMLFTPLGMTTAGFGAPGKASVVDQPRGHLGPLGALKAVEPGPHADNPACLGPAGTVHCSMGDFAKFVALHLEGAQGDTKLLARSSFEKLHRDPYQQGYGFGWLVADRPWAGGEALTHAGSNSMFFAVTWLAPRRNFGLVVATNCGNQAAVEACDTTAAELIRQFAND